MKRVLILMILLTCQVVFAQTKDLPAAGDGVKGGPVKGGNVMQVRFILARLKAVRILKSNLSGKYFTEEQRTLMIEKLTTPDPTADVNTCYEQKLCWYNTDPDNPQPSLVATRDGKAFEATMTTHDDVTSAIQINVLEAKRLQIDDKLALIMMIHEAGHATSVPDKDLRDLSDKLVTDTQIIKLLERNKTSPGTLGEPSAGISDGKPVVTTAPPTDQNKKALDTDAPVAVPETPDITGEPQQNADTSQTKLSCFTKYDSGSGCDHRPFIWKPLNVDDSYSIQRITPKQMLRCFPKEYLVFTNSNFASKCIDFVKSQNKIPYGYDMVEAFCPDKNYSCIKKGVLFLDTWPTINPYSFNYAVGLAVGISPAVNGNGGDPHGEDDAFGNPWTVQENASAWLAERFPKEVTKVLATFDALPRVTDGQDASLWSYSALFGLRERAIPYISYYLPQMTEITYEITIKGRREQDRAARIQQVREAESKRKIQQTIGDINNALNK